MSAGSEQLGGGKSEQLEVSSSWEEGGVSRWED